MSEEPLLPSDRRRHLIGLTLGALGIVYGDIGTSPLYALRECFHGDHAVAVTPSNVVGVLSLILWTLIVVVAVKYHVYVLRFDNRGEGGILALLGLLRPLAISSRIGRWLLLACGLFGAALLYGDGMITPAISVLSAVEGLAVATTFFSPFVVPITVGILIWLFLIQSRGTHGIGKLFGPVMILWFATLSLLGLYWIVREPGVLAAINPMHGLAFFAENGFRGYLVLGAVFLCTTGGEAVYADMGHFGEKPIQIGWFGMVFPALVLNYLGQGALLIRNPEAAHNPFFRMGPPFLLYPTVALATVATIIASQAIISGAFSLTRQAVQLGYLPRVSIVHTSSTEIGQIYIPGVNWVLMLCTIGLVLGFRSSSNLAAAYGIAVTMTMIITTILAWLAARRLLRMPALLAALVTGLFLVAELAFFGANLVKIAHGGWFPLVVALLVYVLMSTWSRGRTILSDRLRKDTLPAELFLQDLAENPPHRSPGTAVFLSGNPIGVPPALLHNLKHNKVLHERVVLLTVLWAEQPHVEDEHRVQVEQLGHGMWRITSSFGFMEDPDIPDLLRRIRSPGLEFPLLETTYFLGKETLFPTARSGMGVWRERLFAAMSRNALGATSYFRLPPNRVVELGAQVEL